MASNNKKVYFVSLGCSKNLVDSEVMLGELGAAGYEITHKENEAKIIVVNTCSFIDLAKEESVETILNMADYKDKLTGNCEVLAVAGCMPQRYGTELVQALPEVDLFIGTGEYQNIVKYIEKSYVNEGIKGVYIGKPEFIHGDDGNRMVTTSKHFAWLKVSEGCDRKCTFCVIPQMRGELRSRTVDSLEKEAIKLVKNGAKELNLISQDLSSYGSDLDSSNTLLLLLKRLETVQDLDWIRLFYHYPEDLTDDLIDYIGKSKKVCSYLDMPVQHFSDTILRRMNRKVKGEDIFEKITRLRGVDPNIVLRSSVIVGFPGETEDDFQKLLDGLKIAKFDHLGVFAYSDEEDAPSFKLTNKIDPDVIEARKKEVYDLQKEIVSNNNKKYLGKKIEVLVEGLHEETDLLFSGRHFGQAPEIDGHVMINDGHVEIGKKAIVEITDCFEYDLVGKVVG